MHFCLICETAIFSQLIFLPCSCVFCHDCLSSWFLEALNSYHLHQIKCPNHHCSQQFSSFKFLEFFPISQKTHLEVLLMKKILNLDQDYVQCLNPLCLTISYKPNFLCLEPFKCVNCDWECQDSKVWPKEPKTLVNGFIIYSNNWLENAWSGVYQDLFTKECPGCRISICKNGGCKHMSCKKCEEEFCWDCLQNWKIHQEFICYLRCVLKWLMILMVFLLGVYKITGFEQGDLMEMYGNTYYFSLLLLNCLVAYYNFSLFLLFYLPFLIILYSIFY